MAVVNLSTHTAASKAETGVLPHFDFVDALRGIAFLMVLACHTQIFLGRFSHPAPASALESVFSMFAYNGRMGVQLFYLISAFTLMHSFGYRRASEARPVLNFFIRRLFRVGPLFWAAILFYNCFDQVRYFDQQNWVYGTVGWSHILLTVLLVHAWLPATINSVVPGGWSVGVEMSFYLIFPLLVTWVRTWPRAIVATVVAVGITLCVNLWMLKQYGTADGLFTAFLYLWLPCQLPVFLLGMVFYFVYRDSGHRSRIDSRRAKRRAWLMFGAAMSIMMAASFLPNRVIYMSHFVFGLAFLCGAWGLLLHPARLFVNALTCFIGRVSYSCYLVHFFVLFVLFREAAPFILPKLPIVPFGIQFGLVYGLSLLVTLVFSMVTYRYIERPGIAMGRRCIERLAMRYRLNPLKDGLALSE